MSRTLVAVLLVGGIAPLAAHSSPGHYREFGDAGGVLNVLPPGQKGVLNAVEAAQAQAGLYPAHVRDQLDMYAALVFAVPGLTDDRLLEFYKEASFGVRDDDVARVYAPGGNPAVVVVRDASFGVPHIFGTTRYATMFAQGYTGAEDRLFLMDVLRHLGRARLSEFLGPSPANEAMDRAQLAIAPYRESDLTAQVNAIRASGAEGLAGYQDLLAYVDGVNRYLAEARLDPTKLPAEYPALQLVPAAWKAEDAVAIASLVGGIFGKGGGGELTNLCGLQAITAALGDAAAARAVFDDLHFANDAEASTTALLPAPYMTDLGPVDPASHPDVDCASLAPIDPGGGTLAQVLDAISGAAPPLRVPHAMSNALLVAASRTRSGRPIAVFGPQTGYFMPQLLVEKDVHGPGIDARGAAFAGVDLYVQIGRGRDFAFSATSSGADNVDQWVLRLCEPGGGAPTVDSMGYVRNGVCVPIERFQHTQVAKPSAGGIPGGPSVVLSIRVERTPDYGPLVARGRLVDGTPIAVATLRSTYGRELESARGFRRINDPGFMTAGYASFRQAMSSVDYTFNWFYVDARDIGYQHSCKCPQRAPGVDPYLPTWGTGAWDWQGFIPTSAEPADLNPPAGFLTSWNNKQAPEFAANDRQFAYGPVFRSQLLDARIEAALAAGPVGRADVVRAMGDAMTVDLRGERDLPLLLEALGPAAPPGADPRAQEMRDRLAAWRATEAHRRDLDGDGAYDDPQAPAIMDAWWTRLSHAMFDAASGGAIGALGLTLDDPNRRDHIGSAFDDAFYSHVNKDLRRVLGRPQADPWSRAYCGLGDPAACRAALWTAMGLAAGDLEAEFQSAQVTDWKRQIADEDIRHQAVGVTAVPAIDWINRPTFQQVVEIPAGSGP